MMDLIIRGERYIIILNKQSLLTDYFLRKSILFYSYAKKFRSRRYKQCISVLAAKPDG